MIVLDASVAIKWFVPDEPERDHALAVLRAIALRPHEFAVPELFFNEMIAVLCRARNADRNKIMQYVSDLEQLGFHRVGNGHELLQKAVSNAVQWRLSGYDAVYVACAQLVDAQWLTADEKAYHRVLERRRVRLLRDWHV